MENSNQQYKEIINLISKDVFYGKEIKQKSESEQIEYCQKFECLTVGEMITEIPESINLLQNLKAITITNNHLEYIPDSIGELKNLTHLNLTSNKIAKLPESMGNLDNLVSLRLSFNQLEKIPDLRKLEHIEELFLNNNKLTNFKWYICYYPKLRHLDLAHNQIDNIPQHLSKMAIMADQKIIDLRYNNYSESQKKEIKTILNNQCTI